MPTSNGRPPAGVASPAYAARNRLGGAGQQAAPNSQWVFVESGGPAVFYGNATESVTETPFQPPRPAPELLRRWQIGVRDGYNKAERKRIARELIAEQVDETQRPSGRYAEFLYDVVAYKAARDGGKKRGELMAAILKGKITQDHQRMYAALRTGERERLEYNLRADNNTAAFQPAGREFFICAFSHTICSSSTATYSRFADAWVSPDGLTAAFRRSEVMNDWLPRHVAQRCVASIDQYQQNAWDWIDGDVARDLGYRWIDRVSCWVPEAVAEELGLSLLNEDGEAIGGYHSSRHVVGKIPSKVYDKRKLPLRMGLELEVEAKGSHHPETIAQEWLKKFGVIEIDGRKHRYCATEHDGSLTNGFECVTGYTGLDVHAVALLPLKDKPFADSLRSHETTTCGLHVHIDRVNMTPLHAFKLNLFINSSKNAKLVHAVARRYNHDRYAAIANKERDAAIMGEYVRMVRRDNGITGTANLRERREFSQLMKSRYREIIGSANGSRYQAVNFANRNTVEFRLFRGTLRYETIMACLEFTRAAWLFSYQLSKNEMTTEAFLKFICDPANRPDTKFLREYLTLKGFDTKERSAYTIPATRLGDVVIAAEDPAINLPAPKANKLHQLQAVAA